LDYRKTLRTARVSADGELAITISEDGEVCVWNLMNRQLSHTLAKQISLTDLTLSTDSRFAVGGEAAGNLIVWNLKNGTVVRRLAPPSLEVPGFVSRVKNWVSKLFRSFVVRTAVAITPDNSAIICAHVDQEGKSAIHVWNVKTWKHVRCIVKPAELIQSVKIASNGSHGFSVGVLNIANGILRLWNIQEGRTVAVVGLNRPFTCLASVPDGEMIILADNEGAIYCYKFVSARES
jgi:WD40 repeat protein